MEKVTSNSKMHQKLLFCALVLMSVGCIKGKLNKPNTGQDLFRWDEKICCCKYITKDNAKFWQNDSLGLNGFRRTISPLILNECNLKNQSWKEMAIFFGKPNLIHDNYFIDRKDAINLIYLTYLDVENEYEENPINSHKTQYYDIVISKKDSLILKAILKYQDG